MKRQPKYKNPLLTVDIIIEIDSRILLIERVNPPLGWALPGGFVDYGESLEASAIREAREETSLDVQLIQQFHTYSAPNRDPRHHSVTTVYIARADGTPQAADDAKNIVLCTADKLPPDIVFDHRRIITDYYRFKKGTTRQDIFLGEKIVDC